MRTPTSVLLLLTAAMILATCGWSSESEVGGQQVYSFRSDPDSEFLRSDAWTGSGLVKHESVIYTDGRFRYSVAKKNTEKTESYETRLSDNEMVDLRRLIVDSGLMQHDHKMAKVANLRNPMEGIPRSSRPNSPSVKLTIQLAEDNCPGRRSRAPVTSRISFVPSASPSNPDVPELQAAAELFRILDQHRDKVVQPRTLYRL